MRTPPPEFSSTMTTPYDLLGLGFYLFPVAGKMPLVRWTRESSNDPKQIAQWERLPGRTGWGCDCGKSGLAVLDIDSGKVAGALETLSGLEFEHGDLPATLTVRTPSGGFHRIYRGEIRNSASSKLGPGLDTRGLGGFVVAPGSAGYEVIHHHAITAVPSWLVEIVGHPVERKPQEIDIELDTGSAVSLAVAYLQTAEPAIEGQGGDDRTFKVIARLRDFGVSEGTALGLLLEHWNDRCSPYWEDEDLARKVANVYRYATGAAGSSNPEIVFEAVDLPDDPVSAPRFKLLTTYDVDKLPPLSWRVRGLVPSRGVFQIYGARSSGKSFLTFDMLAAITEGQEWFGRRTRPCPVLYVCLEGEAGLRQRKDAWELHNGRRLPLEFLMMAQPWSIITKKDITDLARIVPKGSLVVIDTQNRAAPSINESASEGMGQVIEGAKILERLVEGSVGLVAHTGKDSARGVRGHSSQEAAMDAVIEVIRDGDLRRWRTAKVKDGSDGEEGVFGLKVVKVGVDEYGDDVTSCVIDLDVMKDGDGQRGFNLTPAEGVAWACFKMLLSTSKIGGVPDDVWRDDFKAGSPKSGKNAFATAKAGLIGKKLVAELDGLYVLNSLIPVETDE